MSRYSVVHGNRDFEIGKQHADLLLEAAKEGIDGASGKEVSVREFAKGDTQVKEIERETEATWKGRSIVSHGGHNDVLTYHELAVAMRRSSSELMLTQHGGPKTGR